YPLRSRITEAERLCPELLTDLHGALLPLTFHDLYVSGMRLLKYDSSSFAHSAISHMGWLTHVAVSSSVRSARKAINDRALHVQYIVEKMLTGNTIRATSFATPCRRAR